MAKAEDNGLYITRLWKWGIRDTKAELGVWKTNSPCDPGDTTVAIETKDLKSYAVQHGYIRLTPDQRRQLGLWLLGFDQDPQEQINVLTNRLIDLLQMQLLTATTPAWQGCDEERIAWRALAHEYDELTDTMEDEINELIAERDAWRRDASTRAFKMEDLEHEIGELKEKLRRIKGYVNSLGESE